jgi:hypothetical protein
MKHFFLIACLFCLAFNAKAEKKSPADKAKEKTEEMTKDLALNADQQKKIFEINFNMYKSIDDYETKNPTKKLKKKQKDIAQDMRKAQFKKLLTPVQFKKMLDLKKLEKAKEKAEQDALEKTLKK